MTLTVWDEDVTSSDKVGSAVIKLSALCVNGGMDEWFQVQYKGKNCGNIHLRGQWHPAGALTTGTATVTVKPVAQPGWYGQPTVHAQVYPQAQPTMAGPSGLSYGVA